MELANQFSAVPETLANDSDLFTEDHVYPTADIIFYSWNIYISNLNKVQKSTWWPRLY